MGKFVYALVTAFALEFAIWLFAGVDYSQTTLFNFIISPTTTSALYVLIYGAIGGLLVVGIVASAFISINIYGVYAMIGAVFLSFITSIAHLATFVYGELSGTVSPEMALIITAVINLPFALGYSIAVAEWVRGNQ